MSRPSFCDPTLPVEQRVEDLLVRLTTREKVEMLHQYVPAVPRLGLAEFRTGTEALHGVAWLGEATVFPQAIGLGATWNAELVEAVGRAVAIEVRALHTKDPRVSLNVWAPVVNLLRDPRWGRNEEGYSEDVLLTAQTAIAYCRGLRGEHPYYVRTAPTLKHFLAYNNETERDLTSSTLRPRVLREYDLPAFTRPVAAGVVDAIMPAYNLVNGRPAHLSPYLGSELRASTDRELLVVSDATAPSNLVDSEHYYDDHETSSAAALRAGVDSFTDHGSDPSVTVARLTGALDRGLISAEDIDRAARRVLAVRIRTGELDPDLDPYASISESAINLPEHRMLARRAAREQAVLLKNAGDLLPLSTRTGLRVAVVGPFADELRADAYSGMMPYRTTVADGLRRALAPVAGEVTSTNGADRVVLVATSTRRPVRVAAEGTLTCAPGPDGEGEPFDLLEWRPGISTLRSATTGRYVTVRTDPDVGTADTSAAPPSRAGRLAAEQIQPTGWFVHETFTLVERPDGTRVLHNVHLGTYVTLDPETGDLSASAGRPEDAEHFTLRLVRGGITHAGQLAGDADVAVVVVGNDPHVVARETLDRATIALPPAQEELVRAVAAAQPHTVLIVMSSYPYAFSDDLVPAIVWTSHAGQETGNALADVLLGAHAPTGRLPQTWYGGDGDLPDLLEYDIIKARRTYLYFDGQPLYPFGHGLTYTTFGYGPPQATVDGTTVTVTLEVTNTGQRDGIEVVQLYSKQVDPPLDRPSRQLQAFARVELATGRTRRVSLTFPLSALACWDVSAGGYRVDPGAYELMVGRSSGAPQVSTQLVVPGEPSRGRGMIGIDVRAVDFDDYERVTLVDTTRESGDAVAVPGRGEGWILFRAARLDDNAHRLTARVGRSDPGEATLTVRRDDPADGDVLGRVRVRSTGERYAWTTVTGDLDAPAGTYDLYLVLDGEQRLDSFRIDAR